LECLYQKRTIIVRLFKLYALFLLNDIIAILFSVTFYDIYKELDELLIDGG